MAYEQYSGTLSNPGSDIQNIVANKVELLDHYILYQSGENQFTALIKGVNEETADVITFNRSGTYNSNWSISESKGTWDITIYNEYYVYSNIGKGKALSLPVYNGVISYSLAIISMLLCLAVFYKGVLFPCLRRKKSLL